RDWSSDVCSSDLEHDPHSAAERPKERVCVGLDSDGDAVLARPPRNDLSALTTLRDHLVRIDPAQELRLALLRREALDGRVDEIYARVPVYQEHDALYAVAWAVEPDVHADVSLAEQVVEPATDRVATSLSRDTPIALSGPVVVIALELP